MGGKTRRFALLSATSDLQRSKIWIIYYMKHPVLFLCVFLLVPFATKSEEPVSLQKCQDIVNKIDYYTNQRRAGGSSSQMNYLKNMRDKYEDMYTEHNCKKIRNQLK